MLHSLIERLKPYDDRDETIEAQCRLIEAQEEHIELLEDFKRSLESQISSHKRIFKRLGYPLDKMMNEFETTGRVELEDDLPVLKTPRSLH